MSTDAILRGQSVSRHSPATLCCWFFCFADVMRVHIDGIDGVGAPLHSTGRAVGDSSTTDSEYTYADFNEHATAARELTFVTGSVVYESAAAPSSNAVLYATTGEGAAVGAGGGSAETAVYAVVDKEKKTGQSAQQHEPAASHYDFSATGAERTALSTGPAAHGSNSAAYTEFGDLRALLNTGYLDAAAENHYDVGAGIRPSATDAAAENHYDVGAGIRPSATVAAVENHYDVGAGIRPSASTSASASAADDTYTYAVLDDGGSQSMPDIAPFSSTYDLTGRIAAAVIAAADGSTANVRTADDGVAHESSNRNSFC